MTVSITAALDCLSSSNPVCLIGAPGIGKTAMTDAWTTDHGYDLLVDHPVIAQSVDYRGLPAVIDGAAHWLPLGTLRRLTEPSDRPAVLLLDDVGQAPAPVQAALMQIVWARRLGDAALRDNVMIVLATNRVTDRSGVRPLLAALVGRVQMCEVAADPNAWRQWALVQPDIHPAVAAYPGFRPDCYAATVPDAPMAAYCTPRSLAQAGRLMQRGVSDISLLAGWIGEAAASDLSAYAASAAKLPSLTDILAAPEKTAKKYAGKPDLLHAITVIAARAVQQQVGRVLALASALGGGWEIALVSGAADVWPALKQTVEFQRWAVDHRELL